MFATDLGLNCIKLVFFQSVHNSWKLKTSQLLLINMKPVRNCRLTVVGRPPVAPNTARSMADRQSTVELVKMVEEFTVMQCEHAT